MIIGYLKQALASLPVKALRKYGYGLSFDI
jgi:hypothetical protein